MELVLSTFGTNLNIDNNGFVVTQGKERQRIPIDSVTGIQISKGASITSDAALLAISNEIPILFVDRSGHPKGRVQHRKGVPSIQEGPFYVADNTRILGYWYDYWSNSRNWGIYCRFHGA